MKDSKMIDRRTNNHATTAVMTKINNTQRVVIPQNRGNVKVPPV